MTFFTSPNRWPPKPCLPIPHSAPRLRLSGINSGPEGWPILLDAIEQLSFLLFLKRLDEREQDCRARRQAPRQKFTPIFPTPDLRWSHWTQLPADMALKHIKEAVFPFVKTLGGTGGSFAAQMENAEFKINKPSLLIEACKAIDAMQISAQNQDVQGDLYEYLLSKLNTAGQNGQFRTPRHIIRMMVNMRDPRPGERICDPAAGTCGFLVNAWQHLLETHTDLRDIRLRRRGLPPWLDGQQTLQRGIRVQPNEGPHRLRL